MFRRLHARSLGSAERASASRPLVAARLTVAVVAAAIGVVVAATASEAAVSAASAAPNCGTKPVTLNAYFETGFQVPISLSTAFTKQFPNVKFKIRQDQFAVITTNAPRVLNSSNAPDLIRTPSISDLVKDGLLKNLDGYVKAFGWDKFPPSQLVQNRLSKDGHRGSGSLYAAGLNFSMTGVFYNKALAAKIGMTAAPKTVAELESDLAKAKAAGITPIMQWNKLTGGLAFPLQDLMGAYGPTTPINDWIFNKPGATIDTPSNRIAAAHLQQWIKAGYFPTDANAIDYATMMSRFMGGDGLFIFNGDWESGNLGKKMLDAGFFLMPPAKAGGKHGAMSAPLTYSIGAKAKHPDCAAFFLNWVVTNKKARGIDVAIGGSNPGGPANLPLPRVLKGSLIEQTLAAGAVVSKDNGAMDFIANATGSIFAQGWTPELQKMVGGQQTANGLLAAVQAEYQKELGR
jgi:raffinose/stachyose/melibiose transport system substrate-binding protein